jgi:hypothetical protein
MDLIDITLMYDFLVASQLLESKEMFSEEKD